MIKIFVDMDDTMCDFSGAQKKALEKEPGIKWPQSQMDFFRNLKPLPESIYYFNKLKEYYDMNILSRPSSNNLMCLTEKGVWVRDHLGQEFLDEQKFHLSGRKYLFGDENDILIDDVPWPDFKGRQILFGSEEFPDWKSVWKELVSGFNEIESITSECFPDEEITIGFSAYGDHSEDYEFVCYENLDVDKNGVVTNLDTEEEIEWSKFSYLKIEIIGFFYPDDECHDAVVKFKNGDIETDARKVFYRAFGEKMGFRV